MFYPMPMTTSSSCLLDQSLMLSSNIPSFLISLRGGSQMEMAETVDSIYIRAAVGYFNNLRVPAAVLMSIIMKEMFALQSSPPYSMRKWDKEHGIDKSKRWRSLRYTYLLLMVLAFSLETFTIFVATQVLTQLATAQRLVPLDVDVDHEKIGRGFFSMGARKEVHQSMVDFLLKNFEFEYATCRAHFMTGLLSFTIATALRVRYALRKYNDLSMSGMCCLLTVATGMLAYTNANSITYGGYTNLMKRQIELASKFLLANFRSGPFSIMTTFLAILSLFYAISGSFSPEFAYFELDEEDEKRRQ
ncbi:hypothetical protein ACHAWF_004206 [Thalassiosira exigua]